MVVTPLHYGIGCCPFLNSPNIILVEDLPGTLLPDKAHTQGRRRTKRRNQVIFLIYGMRGINLQNHDIQNKRVLHYYYHTKDRKMNTHAIKLHEGIGHRSSSLIPAIVNDVRDDQRGSSCPSRTDRDQNNIVLIIFIRALYS